MNPASPSSAAPSFPPVAIGGLGGSGTRIFAAILQAAGVHIGDCLNEPLDNLWFAVLFKRAAWARAPNPRPPDPNDIATSIRLFQRAMTTGLADRPDGRLSASERTLLAQLRADLPPEGSWQCGPKSVHVDNLMTSGPPRVGTDRPWGWKEPNTHVFLPHLDRHIPGFRYIHVVRDGLDMAFSNNTWQARHWSHLYDLSKDPRIPLPLRQLRYWCAANRRALDYGAAHMPGRFLAVHYEDFCDRPTLHWARIMGFLGPTENLDLPDSMVRPSTIGRSAAHDLSEFPESDLAKVRVLQSEVEKIGQPD